MQSDQDPQDQLANDMENLSLGDEEEKEAVPVPAVQEAVPVIEEAKG